MPRRRYEITDENYERIADLLPGKPGDPGRTARDNRLFVNAVLWMARSGAAWRDLPERFGKWNSVFRRFDRWCDAQKFLRCGVWQRVMDELQDPDFEWFMLDSTAVRAHQHAAGQKKAQPKLRRSAAATQEFLRKAASPRSCTWPWTRSAIRAASC